MRYESKQYPSSGDRRPKKVKVDSMTPSNKGFAKATEVKAGYVYEEGEQRKFVEQVLQPKVLPSLVT